MGQFPSVFDFHRLAMPESLPEVKWKNGVKASKNRRIELDEKGSAMFKKLGQDVKTGIRDLVEGRPGGWALARHWSADFSPPIKRNTWFYQGD